MNQAALVFLLAGQAIPVFVSSVFGAWVCLASVALGLFVHISAINSTVILDRQMLKKISSIFLFISCIILTFDLDTFYACLLMAVAPAVILSGWQNFRYLLRVLTKFRNADVSRCSQPRTLEFLGVLIANFRSFLVDFKDSLRFSLTGKRGSYIWFIIDAIISFLVHLYRVGVRINVIWHIRQFSFFKKAETNENLQLKIIAWGVNSIMIFVFVIETRARF